MTATSDAMLAASSGADSASTGPHPKIRRAMNLPMALSALGMFVFLAGVWIRPLWLDELVTVSVLRRSFHDVWALSLNTDVALGPYYILTYPWGLVSESPVWMRLLSVIAMAVAAGVLAVLGRRVADSRIGLAAGLLFIAVPAVSRYAQEVRPYALATLAACLATYFWWRATETNRARFWISYSACLVLLGSLHAYALTLVLAHVLTTLVFPNLRKRIATLSASIVAAGALLAPYLWLLNEKAAGPGVRPPTSWAAAAAILDLMAGSGVLSVLFGALVVTGAVAAARETRYQKAFVLGISWALSGPVVLIAMQAFADKTTMVPRYYLVFVPGLCLASGVGAAYLFSLWRFSPIFVAIAIVFAGWGQQAQARSATANFKYDASPIIAAVNTPALREFPIWPDVRSFLMLDGSSASFAQTRIPFFTSQFGGQGLAPDPALKTAVRAALSGVPAVILAAGGPADPARIMQSSALGYTQLWVHCRGTHADIRVYVRPGRTGGLTPQAEIIKQITATNQGLKCTK